MNRVKEVILRSEEQCDGQFKELEKQQDKFIKLAGRNVH
jgi:hypothetical protein